MYYDGYQLRGRHDSRVEYQKKFKQYEYEDIVYLIIVLAMRNTAKALNMNYYFIDHAIINTIHNFEKKNVPDVQTVDEVHTADCNAGWKNRRNIQGL